MDIKDFEKSKKELEKAKKQNNEQIAISDERTRMAYANQLENKGAITLLISLFSYVVLFIVTAIIIASLDTSVITSVLNGFSYSIALFGGSLAIGTLANILFIDKKFKTKERFKSFSTAKTQAEKLEEEVHYKIELEKAKNRNRAIDETINLLDSNQSMLSEISTRFDSNNKNAPKANENVEQKVKELSVVIKEQYDKLDLFTAQKVLHDKFWKVRQKFQRRVEMLMSPVMIGALLMFLAEIPMVLLRDTISVSLPMMFIPFGVGVVGSGVYLLKRKKDYKKAFNNLNAMLGEYALSDNLDETFENPYEEEKEIETLIKNKIRDISVLEVQLKEQQRVLEAIILRQTKSNDDNKDLEKTKPMKIRLSKQDLSSPLDLEIGLSTSKITEEVQHQDIRPIGPVLVRRKKPKNLNDR